MHKTKHTLGPNRCYEVVRRSALSLATFWRLGYFQTRSPLVGGVKTADTIRVRPSDYYLEDVRGKVLYTVSQDMESNGATEDYGAPEMWTALTTYSGHRCEETNLQPLKKQERPSNRQGMTCQRSAR